MKITNLSKINKDDLSNNSLTVFTNGSSAELKALSFEDLKSKINSPSNTSITLSKSVTDNYSSYGFSIKLSSMDPLLVGTKLAVTKFSINGASSGSATQAVYIRLVESPIDNLLYTIAEPTYEQLGQSFVSVSNTAVQIPINGSGEFSFTNLELNSDKTYFILFQATDSQGFNTGLVQTRFGVSGASDTIYNRMITNVSQKNYSFAEFEPAISIQGNIINDNQTRIESIGNKLFQLEKVLYSITRS